MAALYSDNFNRANETPLNTGTWGQSGTGSFNLASNQVSHPTDANDNEVYYIPATALGDQYCQFRSTATAGTGDIGIGPVCRHIGSATRTFFRSIISADTVTVLSFTGGASTLVGSRAHTWAVNDVLRMEVTGTSPNIVIKVFILGVQLGANFTGVSGPNIGKPGMAYSSTPGAADTADDWEAGDFSVSGRPPVYAQLPGRGFMR